MPLGPQKAKHRLVLSDPLSHSHGPIPNRDLPDNVYHATKYITRWRKQLSADGI